MASSWLAGLAGGLGGVSQLANSVAAQKIAAEKEAFDRRMAMMQESRLTRGQDLQAENNQLQRGLQAFTAGSADLGRRRSSLEASLPDIPRTSDMSGSPMLAEAQKIGMGDRFLTTPGARPITAPSTMNLGLPNLGLDGVTKGVSPSLPGTAVTALGTPSRTYRAPTTADQQQDALHAAIPALADALMQSGKPELGEAIRQAAPGMKSMADVTAVLGLLKPSTSNDTEFEKYVNGQLTIAAQQGPLTPAQEAQIRLSARHTYYPPAPMYIAGGQGPLLVDRGNPLNPKAVNAPGGDGPVMNPTEQKAMTDLAKLEESIKEVYAAGVRSKWKGVGPLSMGSVQDVARNVLGVGTDAQADLRGKIGALKILVAHPDFGSAFTKTEQDMLNYVPEINMNAVGVRDKLRILWDKAQDERGAHGRPKLPNPFMQDTAIKWQRDAQGNLVPKEN